MKVHSKIGPMKVLSKTVKMNEEFLPEIILTLSIPMTLEREEEDPVKFYNDLKRAIQEYDYSGVII